MPVPVFYLSVIKLCITYIITMCMKWWLLTQGDATGTCHASHLISVKWIAEFEYCFYQLDGHDINIILNKNVRFDMYSKGWMLPIWKWLDRGHIPSADFAGFGFRMYLVDLLQAVFRGCRQM